LNEYLHFDLQQVSQGSNGDAGKNPFDESDNSSGDSRRGSKDQAVIVEEKPIAKGEESGH